MATNFYDAFETAWEAYGLNHVVPLYRGIRDDGDQPEVAPPTFVFFVNHPEFVTRAFENYLKNRIGEDLGLREVPFRLVFRGRREE